MVAIRKTSSGIRGLDEALEGGFPTGRPSLVYGGPGCGKTFIGLEFLARGASDCGEPGVFMSFEESPDAILDNFEGTSLNLRALVESGKLYLTQAFEPSESITVTGDFTLDALRLRLDALIDQLGAKRLVLDNLGALFPRFADSPNLRRELSILLKWIREKGITTLITAEKNDSTGRSSYGFEDYLCDCAIFLDNRVDGQVSKRRLRIVKFRGSSHNLDEIPFVLTRQGVSAIPLSSAKLDHKVSNDVVSTGVESLDQLLGLGGYYRGSSVLVTGKAGSGKSSLAATFAKAMCEAGETCLYFSYEEAPNQIIRNMQSLGIDLQPALDAGTLKIISARPSVFGIEEHIVRVRNDVLEHKPRHVMIDPLSNFGSLGNLKEVNAMFTRVIDQMKLENITCLVTALVPGSGRTDETDVGVSSIMDTWIELSQNPESEEFTRSLHIIKSRGMDHSHKTHPFILASSGLHVVSEH